MAENAAKQQTNKKKGKRGEHLREYSFKPGQSGNPGGRPKGPTITTEIRKLIADPKLREAIAKRVVHDILKGKFPQLKETLDRTEGKVPDRNEVTTGDKPFKVYIEIDTDKV